MPDQRGCAARAQWKRMMTIAYKEGSRKEEVGAVEGDDDRDGGREWEQWKQVMTIAYKQGSRK